MASTSGRSRRALDATAPTERFTPALVSGPAVVWAGRPVAIPLFLPAHPGVGGAWSPLLGIRFELTLSIA